MKKLKIGFISFAHMHASSYIDACSKLPDQVEVVGIADVERERVEPFVKKYGAQYFEDYNDLLKQDIDAVIICSENSRHAEMTIAAARAGKHVLCEKPLGVSLEEMKEMIAACRDNKVQLMTAFPCRFIPAVQRAKEIVDRGDIGRIVAIKGTNRGSMPGGWFIEKELSGGGAVFDHTVHVTDLMRWFTGSEVKEVYAEVDTLFYEVDIDDAGMLTMEFENGVFASLDPSWSRCESYPTWGDVTMEIVGTNGVVSLDSLAQNITLFNDDQKKMKWYNFGDSSDFGLIEAFVSSLLEGKDVPITGEDGMRAALVGLAAYQSAEAEKPVQVQK